MKQPRCNDFNHLFPTSFGTSHLRGVAVEQVVGHRQQALLQPGPHLRHQGELGVLRGLPNSAHPMGETRGSIIEGELQVQTLNLRQDRSDICSDSLLSMKEAEAQRGDENGKVLNIRFRLTATD